MKPSHIIISAIVMGIITVVAMLMILRYAAGLL